MRHAHHAGTLEVVICRRYRQEGANEMRPCRLEISQDVRSPEPSAQPLPISHGYPGERRDHGFRTPGPGSSAILRDDERWSISWRTATGRPTTMRATTAAVLATYAEGSPALATYAEGLAGARAAPRRRRPGSVL